jgi:hypothetical protein
MSASIKAVFLDRDGVINQTVFRRGAQRAPQKLSEWAWIDGVHETLRELSARDYTLIECTNQPDVVRGWQTREQVDAFHALIERELPVSHIYACFHDNIAACLCRKPTAKVGWIDARIAPWICAAKQIPWDPARKARRRRVVVPTWRRRTPRAGQRPSEAGINPTDLRCNLACCWQRRATSVSSLQAHGWSAAARAMSKPGALRAVERCSCGNAKPLSRTAPTTR